MATVDGVACEEGPFQLGSDIWPGLGKFVEEAAEALTVLGKLIATGGNREYWEGRDLKLDIEEEVADVWAAMQFLITHNDLSIDSIGQRKHRKLALYEKWAAAEAG